MYHLYTDLHVHVQGFMGPWLGVNTTLELDRTVLCMWMIQGHIVVTLHVLRTIDEVALIPLLSSIDHLYLY